MEPRALVATSLTGMVMAGGCGSPVQPNGKPPNIVLIISDDHGWPDYGFMGHPHIKTPHLDRLASQSLVHLRGYVPSSLCSPSLTSMITGLYPHQHKIVGNDPPLPAGVSRREAREDPRYRASRAAIAGLLREAPLLPKLLASRGYVSLQTGKWWQGDFRNGGFSQGMTLANADDARHGDRGLEIGRKSMQPIYDFITGATAERRPFFVWYAPMLPHTPHDPPARLLAKYAAVAPTPPVARYWAMVEWFDETCGQLLGFLDRAGLAEDTIVAYVADNGWIQNPGADDMPVRSKGSPYDAGVRTPIMIRWPGHTTARRSDALATSLDLAPTLLRAAGVLPPAAMSGLDLLDTQAVQARTSVFGECFKHRLVDIQRPASSLRWRWMVDGDWKLIVPAPMNEPQAEVQLFNIRQDPYEAKNLAATEGPRVASLRRALDRLWTGAE